MPFRNGSLSYARFRVAGNGTTSPPVHVDQSLLTTIAEHTLQTAGIGEPREVEFGFCGGRHVFDTTFDGTNNVFGESVLFGLRVDTNKVPAEIKRAYRAMSEAAHLDGVSTGFLSRREKQAAREEAEERCRQDLADGRYRRSKLVELWWDLERNVVLAPVFSDVQVTGLRDLFREAFDLRLTPISSGGLACELLENLGRTRDYEDLRPTTFALRPAAPTPRNDEVDNGERPAADRPVVPWAHVSPEASDFIGNEFLLWLWWCCADGDGSIETPGGSIVHFAIDRLLEMECAWDLTGKQTLQGDGPARSPESRRGLQNGKWPRKAGLIIATEGEQFEATLQADRFILSGIKLPRPEEDLNSPQELIEYRLGMVRLLDQAMLNAFDAFLHVRCASGWRTKRDAIREWMLERSRTARMSAQQHAVEVKPDREQDPGPQRHVAGDRTPDEVTA